MSRLFELKIIYPSLNYLKYYMKSSNMYIHNILYGKEPKIGRHIEFIHIPKM